MFRRVMKMLNRKEGGSGLVRRRARPTRQGLGSLAASAYLRLFAAASIVWFHVAHSGPVASVAAVGVGIFIYFSFMHLGRENGFRVFLNRAGKQLLLPWAAWWLFYAATRFWVARGVPPEINAAAPIGTLLAFPAVHLWYLPFVFLASLGVVAVRETLTPWPAQIKVVIALVAGLALVPLFGSTDQLPTTLQMIVYATPAIGLGLVYSYCMRLESSSQRRGWFIAIAALVAVACVPLWSAGIYIVATGYTVASLLMILCTFSLPRNRLLMRLSSLTLGIYLVHPFAILVLWKIVGPFRPRWLFALAAFALSALIVAGMRRVRYLRALV